MGERIRRSTNGDLLMLLGGVNYILSDDEARRLAHALLDAIGERAEAEAIVRAFAEVEPRDESSIRHRCHYCTAWAWGDGKTPPTLAHDPDCPYLRARAFVAREGREDPR